MIITSSPSEIDYNELATLKELARMGAMDGETDVTTNELSGRLDISAQTISRRLRNLEQMKMISREARPDGQTVFVENPGVTALEQEYEEYKQLFEATGELELVGRVSEGVGEGEHFVSLPGYHEQFVDRLGYEPFPGTLNLHLDDHSVKMRTRLEAVEGISIDEWEEDGRTYGAATAYPARLETETEDVYREAHVLVPERTHHGDEQLEIIAPDELRDELDLDDDEVITVRVLR